MILLTIILTIIAIIVGIIIFVALGFLCMTGVLGAGIIFVFGDVIVFGLLIFGLVKLVNRKKDKK